MKAWAVSRPPRTPSTPKYADKTSLIVKPRRSALGEKAVLRPGLELSRPLTARDNSAEMKPSHVKLFVRTPTSAAKREGFRSMSPPMRDLASAKASNRPAPGEKPKSKLENYAIGRQLGQGAYAVVRLGTHKATKEKVAIKSYEKSKLLDPHRKMSVKREVSILEKLTHTHTIKLLETIDSVKHLNLVMEYVGGCSLHGYIRQRANRRIDPVEARRLFHQILLAVEYCHSQNITHRDLKLENILLDDGNNVKLIDFGFSTCMPADRKTSTFCGTPSYMAPEIVGRREYTGPPADIWALGVLLYAIICGCFPFKGANDTELYRKIQRGMYVIPEFVQEGPKRLMRKLLQVDPSKRPTASDLLKDEWIETGLSEVPQPEPPKVSSDSSIHENDLLESLVRLM